MPTNTRVSVDSNFAAARATTGMVQWLGRHPTETTSNLQTAIGLNVSECDFHVWYMEQRRGSGYKPNQIVPLRKVL